MMYIYPFEWSYCKTDKLQLWFDSGTDFTQFLFVWVYPRLTAVIAATITQVNCCSDGTSVKSSLHLGSNTITRIECRYVSANHGHVETLQKHLVRVTKIFCHKLGWKLSRDLVKNTCVCGKKHAETYNANISFWRLGWHRQSNGGLRSKILCSIKLGLSVILGFYVRHLSWYHLSHYVKHVRIFMDQIQQFHFISWNISNCQLWSTPSTTAQSDNMHSVMDISFKLVFWYFILLESWINCISHIVHDKI